MSAGGLIQVQESLYNFVFTTVNAEVTDFSSHGDKRGWIWAGYAGSPGTRELPSGVHASAIPRESFSSDQSPSVDRLIIATS